MISIVLTHWSQNQFRSQTMKECVLSLIETTKHLPVEIIIVENQGLIDDSDFFLGLIREKKIHHYLRNSENLYFGWARNQAVKISSGDYLVFSDNDIKYEKGWLDKCLAILKDQDKKLITPLRTDRQHRNNRHWAGTIEFEGEEYLLNTRAGSNSWVMKREDFDVIGEFRNHKIAGSHWNDQFIRAGYLMITMEKEPMAYDMGFRKGYNYKQDVEIKKIFANGEELIINN